MQKVRGMYAKQEMNKILFVFILIKETTTVSLEMWLFAYSKSIAKDENGYASSTNSAHYKEVFTA